MAPCVDVLRQLSKIFNDNLGADQGIRHAPANLTDDIQSLMESLDEHNVYRIQNGRVLDKDDGPVKDVMGVGLQNLVEGNKNPLSEYNEAFQRLQRRRKMTPVNLTSAPSHQSTSTIPKEPEELRIPGQPIQEYNSIEDSSDDEPQFASVGADDVALDMDIEDGYTSSDVSDDESDNDLDTSDVEN